MILVDDYCGCENFQCLDHLSLILVLSIPDSEISTALTSTRGPSAATTRRLSASCEALRDCVSIVREIFQPLPHSALTQLQQVSKWLHPLPIAPIQDTTDKAFADRTADKYS